jgi:hypothetical protein
MRGKNLIAVVLLSVMVVLGACGTAAQATGGVVVGGGDTAKLAGQSAQPIYTTYTPGLTVVGTGKVTAKPDVVYLTLGVDLKADNAATVVSDASAKMDSILAALKAAGVAEEDIHTASYNLWVEQRYDPQTGQYTGVMDYHIMHSVRITLRDMDKVGTVLAAAIEAGANSVSEVNFSVADQEQLATEARQKAIADAQKRAQEMAGVLGIPLGRVLSVSESSSYTPMAYDMAGRGAATEAGAISLPGGTFEVSISVVIVYELP